MAYERTWAQSLDNTQTPATALEESQRELWSLKAMLLGQYGGLTLGLWSTYYSCDSVTAGTPGDGVDRWGSSFDAGKIVRGIAGAAHSWYVLQSPLMNGFNWYLLITFDTSNNANASFFIAKAPFAGGTTTANPTSVDSWLVSFGTAINAGSTVSHRFNMALSSTGDFWWFVVRAGDHNSELMLTIIAPTGCHPNDTYPIFTYSRYIPGGGGLTASAAFDVLVLGNGAGPISRDYRGAAANTTTMSCGRVTIAPSTYDMLTGAQLDQPMWLVTYNGTSWHHRGRLPDCAMGAAGPTTPANGDVVNPGGGIIAVQMGSFLLPMTAAPDLT